MIRNPFAYHRPSTEQQAAELLDRFRGDAKVMGGGTMLVPSLSLGTVDTRHLVSLHGLGLDRIEKHGQSLCLGALTTYADILDSPLVMEMAPLLPAMAGAVTGGPSILSQGTLGGSACFANPASDAPSCLVALDAELELVSATGVRRVGARSFFRGAFQTARRNDEFLAHIWIPMGAGDQIARYDKHKSCTSSWPIVTVACVLHRGVQPAVVLSVGAAAAVPTLHRFALDFDGMTSAGSWVRNAAAAAASAVGEGWSDELADASYRRAIVPGVVRRMLNAVLREMAA